MNFTKMQGAGNDYIYVDCTKFQLKNPSAVSVRLSDRHFGIGADGLILIKKSEKADFFMEMYNADGSQGKMCGNGIRCVGKYVYDNGLTDRKEITIDTLSGVKTLSLNVGADGKVASARVDMGAPELRASKVPVNIEKLHGYVGSADEPAVSAQIEVGGKIYSVTCVSMGNPHAIVYLDKNVDMNNFDIEAIGPLFENHPAFPDRVNTEFIQIEDRENLRMRVWERGSGETFACGTGACASLVATVLNGGCNETATLHLLGGDLVVSWDRAVNRVCLEGPAVTVFEGVVEIEDEYMMTEMKMNEFLAELSSSAPVPGGGGACGYVAAVGMSLGTMVGNLTTGKKKYAEYQEEIEGLIDETSRITEELAECMDKDAQSFKPLAEAYGLPKSTPQEVAHKEEVMEKALVVASEAPLAMMRKILEAMKLLDRLSVIGSRIAISDVGVGTKLCEAAMSGASLNVYINTKMMKDRERAARMNSEADELVAAAQAQAQETFSRVLGEIKA